MINLVYRTDNVLKNNINNTYTQYFCNMTHCESVESSTYENARDQQLRRKEFNQLKDQRAFPGERILQSCLSFSLSLPLSLLCTHLRCTPVFTMLRIGISLSRCQLSPLIRAFVRLHTRAIMWPVLISI